MSDELEFQEETTESLREQVNNLSLQVSGLKLGMDMLFQAVKAMAEGRKVVVRDEGHIFVEAGSAERPN